MREIMQFYADISPKFPELFSLDTRYLTLTESQYRQRVGL
jgi:hypothetical protein